MKHIHHIIPRHMGGTDDPKNLIEVTIEQHAFLHKQLWEDLGHKEDYIAWRMLSGSINVSEAKKEAQLLGASRGGKIGGPIAGKKSKEKKLGYLAMTKEENIAAGKKSVTMKVGIHNDNWDKAIGGKMGGQKCKEQGIGFLSPNFDKGKASRGKIWINKDGVEIKIFPYELDECEENGWERGRSASFRRVK